MDSKSSISAGNYSILVQSAISDRLEDLLRGDFQGYRPFILTDTNTLEKCLPLLDFAGVEALKDADVLEVEPGEGSKSVEVANQLWESLLSLGADRKSILVNLGGGVVTDLGGFVAATYKRGIPFLNLPTSLLAIVDASVGGKTGVNLAGSKNQVGLFTEPAGVFAFTEFLGTLPQRELYSGAVEMLKHALIADKDHWDKLNEPSVYTDAEIIQDSIRIKRDIVQRDFKENGERKKLNFGHTIGHALEAWSYHTSNPLLHGEAIALGMQYEALLSKEFLGLSHQECDEICKRLGSHCPKPSYSSTDIDSIIAFMQTDKKNAAGNLNFTLLSNIGSAQTDVFINEERVRSVLSGELPS